MKKGISLIAVLMFMLATTTASIVLFRWIGQENFSSGGRLKKSEAYQASQSGLEAVQGWLENKGADAGALIRTFELNDKNPVLLNVAGVDLLGGISSSKQQDFKVYLTGWDSPTAGAHRMKFLSEGIGRDGSKHTQAGIFNVEGLYRIHLDPKPLPNPPGSGPGRKVPPYFGGFGGGTQGNFSSGYIIGDMIASQGISSTEDMMVTGNVNVASGMKIGCPNTVAMGSSYPGNEAYETRREAGEFGNFYVRENFTSQSIMICGDAYIGGNLSSTGSIDIWGNLYVKGNITSKNALRVYGNVTVEGNIELENILDIKGNLAMPSQTNTTHTISLNNANNVNVGGIFGGAETVTCTYRGSDRCGRFTGNNNSYIALGVLPPGGNTLDYLGNQISKEKVNGQYIIPDPIILGAAADWKASDIPAGCTALRNAKWYSNGVITLTGSNVSGDNDTRELRDAIHSCYDQGGNWPAIGGKWLVIRINWQNPNDAMGRMILGRASEMNLILVIENKAGVYGNNSEHPVALPLTTEKTNILLYLTQGAKQIYLDRPPGVHNYFIYSEEDIDRIDGNQYLKGNLFMANGKKVNAVQDPRIEENEDLFKALIDAGVIKNNPNACELTVGGCEEDPGGGSTTNPDDTPPELIGCETLDAACNPDVSYVPVIPHLRVNLQSQYASEENISSNSNSSAAKPAILVTPRAIHLSINDATAKITSKQELAKLINVLYLNEAYSNPENRPSKEDIANSMGSNCQKIVDKRAEPGLYSCTVNLNNNNCNNAELCRNSFYVAIGIQPNVSTPPPPVDISPSSSSSDIPGSSASLPSSSSSSISAPLVSALTCSVSPAVAEGTKISSAVTALCNYNDGTYEWAIADEYYDGTSWILASNTTATLTKGNNKVIKIKARCSTADQIAEHDCGTLDVVGITCQFTGLREPDNKNASKNTFAKGEQINGPTITCSNSVTAVKDNAIFSSKQDSANTKITAITNVNLIKSYPISSYYAENMLNDEPNYIINEKGWISFNGFAYFASGPAGAHKIKVSNVSCGNVSGLGAECSTSSGSDQPFTVTNPTCTQALGSHSAGTPIDIPVLCKIGVPMTNAVFSSPSGNWVNNGSGGAFTQVGNNKNIRLKSGECWGRQITGLDIDCGTVNVTASSGDNDNCDYEPAWCGYISHANVDGSSYNYPQTGSQYFYEGSSNGFDIGSGGRCIFATSITTMGNTSNCSHYRVNGVELKGSSNQILDTDPACSYINGSGSGRCGRINLDNNQPNWGQRFCPAALTSANVQTADGGYYIYIAPGWAGDFITTGGTPVCGGTQSSGSGASSASGGGSCDYDPAWCGDLAFSQVGQNTNLEPTTGQCIFYSQIIPNLQANTGTLCVNGDCKANWNGWYNQQELPAKKDNGYYVHCRTAPCINSSNFGGVIAGSLRTDCTPTPPGGGGTPTITSCTPQNIGSPNSSNCYSVPKPSIVCSDGSTAGATIFEVNKDHSNYDTTGLGSGWNSSNVNQSFCSPGLREIRLTAVQCGGTAVTAGIPVSCGSITIPNASTPTATCNLSNETKALTVRQGQNIAPPVISCSSGALNKSNATFSGGTMPTNVNNWRAAGNAFYSGTTGNQIINVKDIVCGSTNISSDVNCGTITVNLPTCPSNLPSGSSVNSGATITPAIDCGGSTVTDINFNTSGCSWNTSLGSSSGYFSSSSTGNCTLTLIGLKCGDNTISTSRDCGTITVNAAGTDYCYGVTPTVVKSTSVGTTNAVCAKISGNIAGWQASNVGGRTCRINGGSASEPPDNTNQPAVTATSDGYVYIYCSAGSFNYFSMNWW